MLSSLVIPKVLADLFPSGIRYRGAAYFQEGRVTDLSATDDMLHAKVRGTKTYNVSVGLNHSHRPVVECGCPYAFEHYSCKHAWAVLLAADKAKRFSASKPGLQPPRPAVPQWKQRLSTLRRTSATAAPAIQPLPIAPLTQPLTYKLDVDNLRTSGDVVIEAVRTGPGGAFTDAEWLQSQDAADRELAHRLIGATVANGYHYHTASRRFIIPRTMFDTTLRALCETGRVIRGSRSDATSAVPLRWDHGAPWTVRFELAQQTPQTTNAPDATNAANASYELRAELVRDRHVIPVEDAAVFSPNGLIIIGDTISRFEIAEGLPLLLMLRAGGPVTIPADALFDATAELVTMPNAPHIDLPDGAIAEVRPAPAARVIIRESQKQYDANLVATLEFSYDGVIVAADDPAPAIIDRERQRLIRRNMDVEQAAHARLLELGARVPKPWGDAKPEIVIPARAFATIVQSLVAEGFHVEVEGRRYRVATGTDARVSSGIDWFEVEAGVSFGNEHAQLPQLLMALRRGEKVVALADGSVGLLPVDWLRRFATIATLADTGNSANGANGSNGAHGNINAIRLMRTQAGLIDLLLADQEDVNVDETFARIRDEMHSFTSIAAEPAPEGFCGELRTYQQEALGWFSFLRRLHLGGCLADDMGLGKTVQVLALLEQRRRDGAGPSLVIVPTSLVFNWANEAARFTPQLRIRDYTGIDRKSGAMDPADFDLVISTYGTLRRDAPELAAIEFDYVILDESQAIKNARTVSAKAARLLRGRHRLALSGTPIENDISELWSLFDFLNPGMLGASRAFNAFRLGLGEPSALRQVLRPFMLRRTKEQVAPELPTLTEQTLYVDLEKEQREQYDSLRDHYRNALLQHVDDVGIKRSKIQILEALLRLRQAAIHPGLIDPRHADDPSAKFDVLLDSLGSIIGEGHRALVFSQFTSVLALVRKRLETAGISYEYLDGRTRDREERVHHFQNDDTCKVFLISLRAGGYGLNLTAADYVFVLDPWWNPAVEAQAVDRTHRIGQDKHVMALRLIARDTVEEKVLELQRSKLDLADAILGADAGIIAGITREDLELLLG